MDITFAIVVALSSLFSGVTPNDAHSIQIGN